jgi:hypothetical protein
MDWMDWSTNRRRDTMDTFVIQEVEFTEPAQAVERLDGTHQEVPAVVRRAFRVVLAGRVMKTTATVDDAVAWVRGWNRAALAAEARTVREVRP